METTWIALLGVIQGATEFLPVSSSGHLAAGQLILARAGHSPIGGKPLTLEILLHLATFAAVVVYFRREVLSALRGGVRAIGGIFRGRLGELTRNDDGVNLALAVVAGTAPTAALGLALRNPAAALSETPMRLGLTFLACAAVLLASRWWTGGWRRLDWRVALIIGAIQGIAVLPGISRSGVTIAAGLALGLEREEAARFSFLLSLPAILGAAVLELDMKSLAADPQLGAYFLGGLAAFLTGLAALYLLVRLVKQGRFWLFAPYVAAVGLALVFIW